MKITFLGTGTSQGVPILNCRCAVCQSTDSRDKRLRTSVIVETGQKTILIDTTPDLRGQLLRTPVERIDAILYTHSHADHILGIDEIRRFNYLQRQRIDIFGNLETMKRLEQIFDYAFNGKEINFAIPNLTANIVDGPFQIGSVSVLPLKLMHGKQEILGYRIGDFAYCTDVSKIPEATHAQLTGLKVLVLDALRERPHPTHFSIDEAVQQAERIGAERTYLIHMSHMVSHERQSEILPASVALAFDTLRIQIDAEGETHEITGA